MDPMHAQFTRRYNIPLDHLDYKYISACSDVKELENIYKVLLSGEEGRYPELEAHCEARLSSLAPNSRVLRKDQPPLHPSSLDRAEWTEIAADLNSWAASVSSPDDRPRSHSPVEDAGLLPPVRSSATATIGLTRTAAPVAEAAPASAAVKQRRPMPRSYDEWARLEKQLDQQPDDDEEEKAAAKKNQPKQQAAAAAPLATQRKNPAQSLPSRLPVDGLSPEERARLADQEKAKGNEAFRSGDYEEAVVYYTRSASACPLPAAYNNRAFAYLKLQKYTACVKDCGRVLKAEPDNAKALLRRATANHRIHRSVDARDDLVRVLRLEPGNSAATALMAEVDALLAKRGKPAAGAKRMVIEEVGSDDEETEEAAAASPAGGDVPNGGASGFGVVPGNPKGVLETKDAKSQQVGAKTQESPEPAKGLGSEKRLESKKDVRSSDKHPEPTKDVRSSENRPESPEDAGSVEKRSESTKETRSENGPKAALNNGANPAAKKGDSKSKAASIGHDEVKGPADADDFESVKEAGNRLFKAGNYARAMELYERCSQLRPDDSVPYTNRAVCCIKLDRPNDAVYECNMALELDPSNMKAIFRRGVARRMLGFFRESLMDLNLAKSFDPLNKQIEREIAEVEAAMRSSAGRRVLVQEVEDDEEEAEEGNDGTGDWSEADPVPVIRDVGGVVTEFLSAAEKSADNNVSGPDKSGSVAGEVTSGSDKGDSYEVSSEQKTESPLVASDTGKTESSANKSATASDKVAPLADKAESAADEVAPVATKDATASDNVTSPVVHKSAATSDKDTPVADKDAAASDKVTTPVADKGADKVNPSSKVKAPADSPQLAFPSPAADRPLLRQDCSPFEFTQAWLSAARGPAPADQRADLLLAVDPARLPKLLSNKLDGQLLQQIVGAVWHCLLGRDARRAAQVLLSLPAADRFHFVAMFLDKQDKSDLSAALASLESTGAASSDEIRQLKSAYQL